MVSIRRASTRSVKKAEKSFYPEEFSFHELSLEILQKFLKRFESTWIHSILRRSSFDGSQHSGQRERERVVFV